MAVYFFDRGVQVGDIGAQDVGDGRWRGGYCDVWDGEVESFAESFAES